VAFHNTYHFVPVKNFSRPGGLAAERFRSGDLSTHPHVTHDRYAKDAYSGRVICRLTAETPFVVGGRQEKDDPQGPTKVYQYELDSLPAIPASTLRGLISGIVEASSNSALRVLANRVYSFRKKAAPGEALTEIGMAVEAAGDGHYGLLPLRYLKIKLDHPESYKTFSLDDPRYYYMPKGEKHGTRQRPLTEGEYDSLPGNKKGHDRGILRVMRGAEREADFQQLNRKHELFIYCPDGADDLGSLGSLPTLEILPEAVERFHALADLRTEDDPKLPYEPIGTRRNKGNDGDKVRLKHCDLVYFRHSPAQPSKVAEVSFSSIWRGRVETGTESDKCAATTFTFFAGKDAAGEVSEELLPFHRGRRYVTLAEQMFGFVEENQDAGETTEVGLAGRIYPSPARWAGVRKADDSGWESTDPADCYLLNPADPEGWTTLKILSSPKPPSPSMYFKKAHGGGAYIPKTKLNPNEHAPQGRKFYLHHRPSEKEPWKTADDGKDLSQKMRVRPVRENTVFYFHCNFDNLSGLELGALLYALRPAPEFRHKLGLGKPIGLGRVRIDPVGLFVVDRSGRYSSGGLLKPRYAYAWHSSEDQVEELPDRYGREKEANGRPLAKTPEQMREVFRAGMDGDIRFALELIGRYALDAHGRVDTLSRPVHTPALPGRSDEEETYSWFVENDRVGNKSPQWLEPLRASATVPTKIPKLD